MSTRSEETSVKTTGNSAAGSNSQGQAQAASEEDGCRVCNLDTDHANLLLCETCNAEYHIYCLNPPLEAVPDDDWYCPQCAPSHCDNLAALLSALPADWTCRFNEIVWCQGGVGYGWWPACIFNPLKAIGAARTQATKHLGKKHLVYFFYCNEAPFEIKPESAITSWDVGLAMGYHLGRTAQASGHRRFKKFQLALQAACIEESVPKRLRMKWTFADEPKYVATPQKAKPVPAPRGRTRKSGAARSTTSVSTTKSTSSSSGKRVKRNLTKEMEETTSHSSSGRKRRRRSSFTDNETTATASAGNNLFCQVYRRYDDGTEIPVGLVSLPSHKLATFADVRRTIRKELCPTIPVDWSWNFWVPGGTGAVSTRQESKVGSMMTFLWEACPRKLIGEGNLDSPARIILIDAKPVLSWAHSIS